MILLTTDSIPGRPIAEVLGLVRGNSVRARHIGRDIVAALRNIVGGEITEYMQLQSQSKERATQRMISEAEALGSDAIVNVRYATSMIATGTSEILAYGMAVKLSG